MSQTAEDRAFDEVSVSDEPLLSVSEAAALAGVSRQSIHMWLRHGRLSPALVEGPVRIRASAVQRQICLRRIAANSRIHPTTLLVWHGEHHHGEHEDSS